MGSHTMKALQLTRSSSTAPPKLSAVNIPVPQLKPGHALVQIHYASIQPSDRLNAQGLFPSTTFPRIPGRDYSGIVVETAEKNDAVKSWIGKKVYGTSGPSLGFVVDGTHVQYCQVPQAALVEKPASLSLLQAATVGVPFTTAIVCLRRAQVTPNDVVLVLGANGAVGSAATQIATAMGCKQVLTAARREDWKPDVVLSPNISTALLEENVSRLTGGRGVDVVIDTVGDLTLMSVLIDKLAMFGRYAWIASPRGDADKKVEFDVFQAYRKELSLLGCNSVARPVESSAVDLRSLGIWINQGKVKAQTESEFETVALGDAIEEGYDKIGKVVIDMGFSNTSDRS